MPSKNEVKLYVQNGYYHLYNRGVEKRSIFLDKQDYATYLSYLKTYLLPKDEDLLRRTMLDPEVGYQAKEKILKLLRLKNFSDTIDLLAYCLMPNHFHFLIHQTEPDAIHKFMNAFPTRYSMYFNKKYHRVGPLFQGIYKAVLVETDEQLMHLSRYIHHQAAYSQGQPLRVQQPSSYPNYLGDISQAWVKPHEILSYFHHSLTNSDNKYSSYQSFVEGYKGLSDESMSTLTLDE